MQCLMFIMSPYSENFSKHTYIPAPYFMVIYYTFGINLHSNLAYVVVGFFLLQ